MKYAFEGSLRKCLPNLVKEEWHIKLLFLSYIIGGLDAIHQLTLVHRDFHDGNILKLDVWYEISDFGLCQPVDYFKSSKNDAIYGVLPFIAPEVLKGNPYVTASDIYSFSMIMWEFTSGVPPFHDRAHDVHLALDICKGERPKIIENTPQCYSDLMKKCWNENPLKRPNALEISNIINNWYKIISNTDTNINEKLVNIIEFYKADKVLEHKQTDASMFKSHPQAYHTSRLLDFTTKLNEILDQESEIFDKVYETEISQSIGNYFILLNIKFFKFYDIITIIIIDFIIKMKPRFNNSFNF